MAVRKSVKKNKVAPKKKPSAKKITLPAFGLAEDILGKQAKVGEGEDSEVKVAKRDEGTMDIGGSESPILNSGVQGEDRSQELVSGPELHLVTFRLESEEYGVDIGSVQEIIRVGNITSVPNSPEYVQGVINLRGRILPVLNLRSKLCLPDAEFTKDSRIVVVESMGRVLGLLVDAVSQVTRIPLASVEEPPGDMEETRAYVRNIGKIDSRLIMIMDLEKVLMKDARQTAA